MTNNEIAADAEGEDPRVGIVLGYLDAFSRGDIDHMMQLSADDPLWVVPGRSYLAGDHRGQPAVAKLLGELRARLEPFELRPQDVLVSAKHIAVIHDMTAIREERSHALAGGFVFDVRDGHVLKVFSFTLDLYALDELLGSGRGAAEE